MTTAKFASVPRKMYARGVQQSVAKVGITAKVLNDGSPNPNYERAVQEAAELTAALALWTEFVSAARAKGFRENSYKGKARSGEVVEEGCGFVRQEAGLWVTYTRQEVLAEING